MFPVLYGNTETAEEDHCHISAENLSEIDEVKMHSISEIKIRIPILVRSQSFTSQCHFFNLCVTCVSCVPSSSFVVGCVPCICFHTFVLSEI